MIDSASPSPVEDAELERHGDAGRKCLVGHQTGDWRNPIIFPPCIKCVCGEWVRPEHWESHSAMREQNDV